jgi:hypothetical protein
MKVFNKVGSKERLIEMFEKVNKTKVKEKVIVEGKKKETINEWGIKVKPSRVNESFDSPEDKDKEYLDKTVDTNVDQQTKYDDGTRYPVEEPLKVADPSLEKMKGDDKPIAAPKSDMFEDDDQDIADKDEPINVGDVEPEPNDGEADFVSAEIGDETPDDAVDAMDSDEISTPDEIEGGLGDDASVTDYDPDQISKGIKVEMEHTDDPKIALEITLDHLAEDPQYYGAGDEDPEAAAMAGAQADAEADAIEPSDEEGKEKEILWGKLDTIGDMGDGEIEDLEFEFEPKNVGEDFDFAGAEREFYDKQDMDDSMARYEELVRKGPANLRPDEQDELARLEQELGVDPNQMGV